MCFSGARANTRGDLDNRRYISLHREAPRRGLFNTSHRWRIELGLHSLFSASLRRCFLLRLASSLPACLPASSHTYRARSKLSSTRVGSRLRRVLYRSEEF